MKIVFGYGSNMGSRGLAAKGVRTARSRCGYLSGYSLAFDVPCPFHRVEGGVANVVLAPGETGGVHGVAHEVDAEGLARIDGIEAVGLLYERRTAAVHTYDGETMEAEVYVGLPAIRDATLRPSIRYIRVLVDGAVEQGIDPAWIQRLRETPAHVPPRFGRFEPPSGLTDIDATELARHPEHVALGGVVFDLAAARPAHSVITMLRGGKDLTPVAIALGAGTDESLAAGERQVAALHELQHELALDYPIVGRFVG
jgi:sulfite reductase (NADPH) flavoprotein alpha-component